MQFSSPWNCNFKVARVNRYAISARFSAISPRYSAIWDATHGTLSRRFAISQVYTLCLQKRRVPFFRRVPIFLTFSPHSHIPVTNIPEYPPWGEKPGLQIRKFTISVCKTSVQYSTCIAFIFKPYDISIKFTSLCLESTCQQLRFPSQHNIQDAYRLWHRTEKFNNKLVLVIAGNQP